MSTTPRMVVFAWVCTASLFVAVMGIAAFKPAPSAPPPPPQETWRALFDEVVRDEPKGRVSAKEDWAHHRWSQHDAFGALERSRVTDVAHRHGLSPFDVFGVLDVGLRQHWPGPDGKPLDVSTVPLKPRPLD